MDYSQFLEIDPDCASGLRWKKRPDDNPWNARWAGKMAGCLVPQGYWRLGINGKLHYAHRIIWTLLNGPIPELIQIDHEDGNRANNSHSNLRLATHAQNQQNTKIRAKSGFKGVWKSGKAFYAQIHHNNKNHFLGKFLTAEAAGIAYAEKARELFGEYANY